MSIFLEKIFALFQPTHSRRLENQLRAVSISGRVAYCTTCLEEIFITKQLHEPELDKLLSCLWDFTSSSDLSDWEEKIMDFLPEGVLEDPPGEQVYLSQPQITRLKEIYSTLPKSLLSCITATIGVGCNNLYAGTVGYSAETLTPTTQVVRYMLSNNYPLPPIENFLRSPFSEQDQHGWGKSVDRNFFQ